MMRGIRARLTVVGGLGALVLTPLPAQATGGPVITLTDNVIRHADTLLGAHVTYAVTVSSPAGGATVRCDRPSDRNYPLGITIVHCYASDAAGATARRSFTILVALRGGRFATPVVDGGLVQKGDRLDPSFALYQSDGRTLLSDADALALYRAGRVRLTTQRYGSPTVWKMPLTYSARRHRFAGTVQTFGWIGGADYIVTYVVLAPDRTLIAAKRAQLGVRLGA